MRQHTKNCATAPQNHHPGDVVPCDCGFPDLPVSRDTPRPEEAYDRVMARVNEAQTGSPTAPRERETPKKACGHGTTKMGCAECQAEFYRSESPAPVPPVVEARTKAINAARDPNGFVHIDVIDAVDALCAAVRAEERKQFAAEARTRLCAIDPVGLRTGPLYDWLTKEMGQ